MFNRDEWSEILKNAYGFRSEKIECVRLFETRRGMEMNIVGDYIECPQKKFFEKTKAEIRTDSNPKINFPDVFAPQTFFNDSAVRYATCVLETYRLNVDKSYEKVLLENIHQKSRNLIYKAEKCGVKTGIANDEESLWKYYKMYVRSMCGIGAIPQCYALFHEMRKSFGKDFLLFISSISNNSARDGEKNLAGIVALRNGKRLHIWSNGQSRAAREFSANMGCYAAVIKFACEDQKIEEIDFGNSEPGTSLAFFKSRFGAKKIPIWTVGVCSANNSISTFHLRSVCGQNRQKKIMSIAAKLLGFLPVPVISMVSRFLFKYLR